MRTVYAVCIPRCIAYSRASGYTVDPFAEFREPNENCGQVRQMSCNDADLYI